MLFEKAGSCGNTRWPGNREWKFVGVAARFDDVSRWLNRHAKLVCSRTSAKIQIQSPSNIAKASLSPAMAIKTLQHQLDMPQISCKY